MRLVSQWIARRWLYFGRLLITFVIRTNLSGVMTFSLQVKIQGQNFPAELCAGLANMRTS